MPVPSVHQILLLANGPPEAGGVPEDEPVPVLVLEHGPGRGPAHPGPQALLVLPVTVGVLSILDSQLRAEERPDQS